MAGALSSAVELRNLFRGTGTPILSLMLVSGQCLKSIKDPGMREQVVLIFQSRLLPVAQAFQCPLIRHSATS
jgi:hypothetical protein